MVIPAWLAANFADLVTGNQAILAKLKMDGMVRTGGWGTKLVEPLRFPVLTGSQVIQVTDPFADITAAQMTGYTAAEYTPCEKIIDLSIPEYDLDQLGDDTQKINRLESDMENAIDRVMIASPYSVNEDLWRAPESSGSAGNRQYVGSLKTFFNAGVTGTTTDGGAKPAALTEQTNSGIVDATGSQNVVTLVGNIERAAAGAAYWCTPVYHNGMTAIVVSVTQISKGLSLSQRGKEKANLIIVHRDLFDVLQGLLTVGGANGGQMYGESALANVGFDALKFRNADIITDDSCPVGGFLTGTSTGATTAMYRAYFINTKYLKYRVKSMKPAFRRVDDARPIKRWVGRLLSQITSDNLGRAHAVHAALKLS